MQHKRSKRSRNRAARKTAGYGSKKKHRGSGHRGGVGNSSIGKRGSAKLMKVTKGNTKYLGKYGFKSLNKKINTINLQDLQDRLVSLSEKGLVTKEKDHYFIDLEKLNYDKLLSKGIVTAKMKIKVTLATENAISKVEAVGGTVTVTSSDEKSEENK